MACGIDKSCIESAIRELIKTYGDDFARIEQAMATQTGRAPDLKLDAVDIDQFVKQSGATSGSGFVHRRVVKGFLEAIDKNGDGITAQEWAQRPR